MNSRQLTCNPPARTTGSVLGTLLIGAVIAGCSSAPEYPAWIDDPSSAYPAESHLSTTGQATTQAQSSARALTNLSRLFSDAVTDKGLDFATVRRQEELEAQVAPETPPSAASTTITNEQQSSRRVGADIQKVLRDAGIAEHWVSPGGMHYSLAVLERLPAALRLSRSVRAADNKTAERLNYAANGSLDPVEALSALHDARLIQRHRDALNRNLKIVDGSGINGPYNSDDIEYAIKDYLASLRFAVRSDSPVLAAGQLEALKRLGIQHDQQSPYLFAASFDPSPIAKHQGVHLLRGVTGLKLLYQGQRIAEQNWPVKISGTEWHYLEQQATELISDRLGDYLYTLLTSNYAGY